MRNSVAEPKSLPRAIWALAVALTIFIASSRSHVASPDLPDSDKVAHFAVYGLLATLICRLGRGWRMAVFALIAASLFGASDEWHQSFVPGRSCDFYDWLADTLGAALAATCYTLWAHYRSTLERPILASATAERGD
jgi:VanZ family protein